MSTCPCSETCDYHKPAARPARVGTRLKCRLISHGFDFPEVEADFGPDGRNTEKIEFGVARKSCRVVGWQFWGKGFDLRSAGFIEGARDIHCGDALMFLPGAACVLPVAFDTKPDDQLADWDRRFSDAKDYA